VCQSLRAVPESMKPALDRGVLRAHEPLYNRRGPRVVAPEPSLARLHLSQSSASILLPLFSAMAP
jgi:hypothetical protein